MKKRICLLGLCVIFAISMAACGKKEEKKPVETEVKNEKKEIVVEDVEFEWANKETDENGMLVEYAVIRGCDKIGKVAWEITTKEYQLADQPTVEKIGICDDKFYYTEGGKIVALNLQDGKMVWENTDYNSYGIRFVFGEDGILYCGGIYGTDLLVIDKEGKTQKLIPELNEQYSGVIGMALQDNQLMISFSEGPYEGEEYKKCIMNLADYSYSFPQPPQQEVTTPQPTQPATPQKTQMSIQQMCDAIAAHYNALYSTSEYVCYDMEAMETSTTYEFFLRTTGRNEANVLVSSITVDKNTGMASDEFGHSWQLL